MIQALYIYGLCNFSRLRTQTSCHEKDAGCSAARKLHREAICIIWLRRAAARTACLIFGPQLSSRCHRDVIVSSVRGYCWLKAYVYVHRIMSPFFPALLKYILQYSSYVHRGVTFPY
jgi:hypothetical protein